MECEPNCWHQSVTSTSSDVATLLAPMVRRDRRPVVMHVPSLPLPGQLSFHRGAVPPGGASRE